MFDKAILEKGGTSGPVPECNKNQQICDKAIDSYPHASKFVFDCYMIQNFVIKLSTHDSTTQLVPECHKTQKMFDKAVYRYFFAFSFVPDQNKTQIMCNEAVGDCLVTSKFISDWFITSKMLEKIDKALLVNDDILFFNEDFEDLEVTLIANQRHILGVALDKFNLDKDNKFV